MVVVVREEKGGRTMSSLLCAGWSGNPGGPPAVVGYVTPQSGCARALDFSALNDDASESSLRLTRLCARVRTFPCLYYFSTPSLPIPLNPSDWNMVRPQSSAAGVLALLSEPEPVLKEHALRVLNALVPQFWAEISEQIELM